MKRVLSGLISFLMAIAVHVWFFAGYIGVGGTFPKPLSAKEEEEYLQKMAEGDLEAKNVLIERNLRLVAHVVKKYSPLGKDNEDLISIGTIGLIKGVTSFKAGKGTRLATYVARCIDNEILMHIRSSKKLQNEVSIHDTIGVDREGNEITLMDIVEDEREEVSEQVNSKMQVANLYDKMKQVLAGREYDILTWRFGLHNKPVKTQHEIAERLGISRSYVSRIEKKALEKLKEGMNS